MAIADFPYSFASQPIIDPTTGQPVLNATGGVLQDPASGALLSMADMNGNPITQITGNAYGMSQQFRSTQLAVLVKFGTVYVQAPSIEMFDIVQKNADLLALAQSAQALAQAAAASAQAAAASAGTGGAGGVTVHGQLSGLGADDHPQYHNDTRGDARYYTQAQVTAAINTAVTSSSTADRNRANHSGTQLASSISDFSSAVQAIAGPSSTPDWSVITNKPTTFTPSAHTHPAGQISDSTATGRAVVTAVDAQAARVAIGAGTGNGTSNLTLGTTATTAAAGNHGHAASALTFTPAGSITATDVQAAIVQASQSGGGSGVSAVFVWRYSAGGWPAMPATKPAGVFEVRALGPSYPTAIPTWVGLAAAQVPMSYSKVDVA